MLTPRLLLVLRAVVERGTLTAAATALGYTVSAVSQQLSQLEREAGSPLLEKAGRGVRPTAAGLLLAEHATRILAAVDDAEGALSDLRAGRTGRLRVVSFHSAGETLLPQAVAVLRRQMPGLHVMPLVDEPDQVDRNLPPGAAQSTTADIYARANELGGWEVVPQDDVDAALQQLPPLTAADLDQNALAQPDGVEIGAVGAQGQLVIGAAIDILE